MPALAAVGVAARRPEGGGATGSRRMQASASPSRSSRRRARTPAGAAGRDRTAVARRARRRRPPMAREVRMPAAPSRACGRDRRSPHCSAHAVDLGVGVPAWDAPTGALQGVGRAPIGKGRRAPWCECRPGMPPSLADPCHAMPLAAGPVVRPIEPEPAAPPLAGRTDRRPGRTAPGRTGCRPHGHLGQTADRGGGHLAGALAETPRDGRRRRPRGRGGGERAPRARTRPTGAGRRRPTRRRTLRRLPRPDPDPPARAPAARLSTARSRTSPDRAASVSTRRRHQWAMAGQARLASASGRKSTAT